MPQHVAGIPNLGTAASREDLQTARAWHRGGTVVERQEQADLRVALDLYRLENLSPRGRRRGTGEKQPDVIGPVHFRSAECNAPVADRDEDASWTLTLDGSAAEVAQFRESVADVLLLCHYSLKPRARA